MLEWMITDFDRLERQLPPLPGSKAWAGVRRKL